MAKALERVELNPVQDVGFSRDQVDLIKRTVAPGLSDDELTLFLHTASRYQLDPLLKEIHAVKYPSWNNETRQYEQRMSIQVGIDGYRKLAERTGNYCPGPDSTIEVVEIGEKRDMKATAHVLKRVHGEWHMVTAHAWFSEYVRKNKKGEINRIWRERPKGQLEKCAETLAIRKAFAMEVGPLRTTEEMAHLDVVENLDDSQIPAEAPPAERQPSRGGPPPNRNAEPPTGDDPASIPEPNAEAPPTRIQRDEFTKLIATCFPKTKEKVIQAAEVSDLIATLSNANTYTAYDTALRWLRKTISTRTAEKSWRKDAPAEQSPPPRKVDDDDLPF